jgi:hypothetical protein
MRIIGHRLAGCLGLLFGLLSGWLFYRLVYCVSWLNEPSVRSYWVCLSGDRMVALTFGCPVGTLADLSADVQSLV